MEHEMETGMMRADFWLEFLWLGDLSWIAKGLGFGNPAWSWCEEVPSRSFTGRTLNL